jgi:hypothetical protein
MRAQRRRERLEVDGEQARARAVRPARRQVDRYAQYLAQVRRAAEIAEHQIALHAALLDLPGRHCRVEASREQRHRAALDAERQPARTLRALGEERRVVLGELEPHRHLGLVEIDAGGVRQQRSAELALDLARARGSGLAPADAPRAHGEVAAANRVGE